MENFKENAYIYSQMSLYEDLVAAWVPAKHDWLRLRPLGEELVRRLGKQMMYSYCACMCNTYAVSKSEKSQSFSIPI